MKTPNNGVLFLAIGVGLLVIFGAGNIVLSILLAFFSSPLQLIVLFGLVGFLVFLIRKGKLNLGQSQSQFSNLFSQSQSDFIEQLVRVLCLAMNADGKISAAEKQVLMQFFQINMGYGKAQLDHVAHLMAYAIENPVSLDTLCLDLKRQAHETKLIVLQLVYRIVTSDGKICEAETQFIQDLVQKLGLSQSDHERIRAMFSAAKNTRHDDYAVLGLAQGASPADIKKAYRALCKEHHPDKVHHLGPEFKKLAEEKMQKINAAYANLSKT